MARAAKEIVKAAAQLPERERVLVVEQLLTTLEPAPDEKVDAEWAAEIERRSREIKRGVVRPIPWEDVKARASKRVRGSR